MVSMNYRVCFLHCVVLALFSGSWQNVHASEYVGLHSQGMGGAHRGLGTSNDTLFVNPAGMSMTKRYTIEGSVSNNRKEDRTSWTVSAVDSKSGPVAGGLGWLLESHSVDGKSTSVNRFILGLSLAPIEFVSFGFNANYFTGETGPTELTLADLSHFSGDIGMSLSFMESFRLGVATRNVFSSEESDYLPMTTGAGFGFVSNRLNVAADLVWNHDLPEDESLSYHAGVEYFAQDIFPLRLGYQREVYRKKDNALGNENILSAGLGWVSMGGSFEFAYKQSIERPARQELSFGLKFFL